MEPLIGIINQAKENYYNKYGFYPETIHVSRGMEIVLHRWAFKNHPEQVFDKNGAAIAGLEVLRSTKNSPHLEFWLSAKRGDKIYASSAKIEPEAVGASKLVLPGVGKIG